MTKKTKRDFACYSKTSPCSVKQESSKKNKGSVGPTVSIPTASGRPLVESNPNTATTPTSSNKKTKNSLLSPPSPNSSLLLSLLVSLSSPRQRSGTNSAPFCRNYGRFALIDTPIASFPAANRRFRPGFAFLGRGLVRVKGDPGILGFLDGRWGI